MIRGIEVRYCENTNVDLIVRIANTQIVKKSRFIEEHEGTIVIHILTIVFFTRETLWIGCLDYLFCSIPWEWWVSEEGETFVSSLEDGKESRWRAEISPSVDGESFWLSHSPDWCLQWYPGRILRPDLVAKPSDSPSFTVVPTDTLHDN